MVHTLAFQRQFASISEERNSMQVKDATEISLVEGMHFLRASDKMNLLTWIDANGCQTRLVLASCIAVLTLAVQPS